jgi:hypothetical protein
MTNSFQHYKRVVDAMKDARWNGLISFEKFSDNDREMIGSTESEETHLESALQTGKEQIGAWMSHYSKNRWENQDYYPEVFIEKKALQGVFEPICRKYDVGLGACKGYPSLTFLNDTAKRFIEQEENGKIPVILYFGDYDPSGEDIPRSIEENIRQLGCSSIRLIRFALMKDQVLEWELPPAPTKKGDSRTANWDGLGQVELDAVDPYILQELAEEAIKSVFDTDRYEELLEIQEIEKKQYKKAMRKFVLEMK